MCEHVDVDGYQKSCNSEQHIRWTIKVGVKPITNVIRSGRLILYGHVMRKIIRTGLGNVWRSELKAGHRLENQEKHG